MLRENIYLKYDTNQSGYRYVTKVDTHFIQTDFYKSRDTALHQMIKQIYNYYADNSVNYADSVDVYDRDLTQDVLFYLTKSDDQFVIRFLRPYSKDKQVAEFREENKEEVFEKLDNNFSIYSSQ